MNTGNLVMLIPIVAIVGYYLLEIIKIKHKVRSQNSTQSEHYSEMTAEIRSLRQRVETLEAIVTQEGFDVKREINRL